MTSGFFSANIALKFQTMKDNKKQEEGIILETYPDATFKVKLDSGREVLAYISGKMRLFHIRILIGDRVRMEFSPYDDNRGRINYRYS